MEASLYFTELGETWMEAGGTGMEMKERVLSLGDCWAGHYRTASMERDLSGFPAADRHGRGIAFRCSGELWWKSTTGKANVGKDYGMVMVSSLPSYAVEHPCS